MFCLNNSKSKSKMYLEYPKFGTTKSDAPKFSSATGFLAVFTYELEVIVLFLSMYDLKIDI